MLDPVLSKLTLVRVVNNSFYCVPLCTEFCNLVELSYIFRIYVHGHRPPGSTQIAFAVHRLVHQDGFRMRPKLRHLTVPVDQIYVPVPSAWHPLLAFQNKRKGYLSFSLHAKAALYRKVSPSDMFSVFYGHHRSERKLVACRTEGRKIYISSDTEHLYGHGRNSVTSRRRPVGGPSKPSVGTSCDS